MKLPHLLLISAGFWNFVSNASAQVLKAGFADREIVPDPGMEVPGGYGKAFAKEVHDPPKVRAAVFDDGRKRIALVGVDALLLRRDTVLAARKLATEKCGIPGECIMLGASHSHTSGPTGMIAPGDFDHATDFVKDLAYQKSSTADLKYLRRVESAIAEAIAAADAAKEEARLCYGFGKEERVSFNRRQRMKNGLCYSHAGRGNPDILGYAGPIDPDVGVVGAWTAAGKPLGVIVNFACHATTGPSAFSANWIYYLEKTIRGGLGVDVPVVFLQGCCGDITQVDNLDPYVAKSADYYGQLVGGSVGAEALKVLFRAERGGGGVVDSRARTWRIRRRVPDPERVKRCTELAKTEPNGLTATDWTFAKEIVLLDALITKEPDVEVEVQAMQVGPVAFLSNPAEFFVDYGLDLKKRSPFKMTFPVELANGCVGYVPTEEAMGLQGGGYETRLTCYSNLEVTAGRQFVDAALAMAREMTPMPMPEPAKAPAWKAPWSYGNVPPELK